MANAKRRKLQRQHPKAQKPKPTLHGRPDAPTKQRQQQKQQQQQQQQHHEAPIIPFRPDDKILLIGEGDLSFAASIIQHHGCEDVTATVLEKDHAELAAKHPSVDANISSITGPRKPQPEKEAREMEENTDPGSDNESTGSHGETRQDTSSPLGASHHNNKLLYNIDATKLPASLARPVYATIVFNFPHVGGKSTDVNRQVRYNQELLVSFFKGAMRALRPGGSIVVTLFDGEPYTLWNIRDLGRHSGLQVERSFRFQPAAYPGYRHARTLGVVRNKNGHVGGGWKGEERSARSYVFRRKGEVVEQQTKKRRKRPDDDSSDEND